MGKNPWEESDPDLLALRKPPGTTTRWGRVLLIVGAVALVTFVAAYYIPLVRAHQTLVDEFKALGVKRQELADKLTETERKLDKESKEKEELKAKNDERVAGEQSRKEKLEALRQKAASKLSKAVAKKQATVELGDAGVKVTLSNNLVFKPHTLDIHRDGSRLLCEIAQLTSGPLRVTALAKTNEPPSVLLTARYPTARALSAARAALAASDLEKQCQVPSAQLEATSVVHAADQDSGKVAAPLVIIDLLASGG